MGISIGIGIPSGVLSSGSGLDGTSFITTWRTTVDGETITIPIGTGSYNYTVKTSD